MPGIRDLGYSPGVLPPGPSNSVLDVPGVHISQMTLPTSSKLEHGSNAAKGVTIISPRPPEDYYKPCSASVFTFNGNGELTGSHQIADWGFINSPIALTNSLSLGLVYDAVWQWILDQQDKMGWDALSRSRHYCTPVVAETCDWMINSDIRQTRLDPKDIRACLEGLRCCEDGGVVQLGQHGGGAGMTTHEFCGGTGSASRLVGDSSRGKQYTLGVLCQSNYGNREYLSIGGVPIGKFLPLKTPDKSAGRTEDGSIVIVLITDAPLASHQLNRLARHATAGLAQVGTYGVGHTFSGDIFLAVSTAEHGPEQLERFTARPRPIETYTAEVVKNESVDLLFDAAVEAVEEAILNCLVAGGEGKIAMDGTKIEALPVDTVKALLEKHLVKA